MANPYYNAADTGRYQMMVMDTPMPKFQGTVIFGSEGERYKYSSYQYATTSEKPGMMQPLAVIYVASEDDIIKAINYAQEADIAISIRSGGHHFMGASSTNGRNIQLDMSGYKWDPQSMGKPKDTPYPFHFMEKKIVKGKVHLHIGPSVGLETLSQWLMDPDTNGESVKIGDHQDKGYFMPYGECRGVHFGGHCQTGGVSPFITTIFGILCDYLVSIDIIMADQDPKGGKGVARKRTIYRDTKDPYERDVFFSTIGGSPGNFGVIVGATIAPMADKDFPESRSLLAVNTYSNARWKTLMDLYSKWCDKGMPETMTLCVTMMGSSFMTYPSQLDQEMQDKQPDLFFGPKSGPLKTFDQEQRDQMSRDWAHPLPIVMVSAFWCDKKHPNKKYEDAPEAHAFFKECKDAIGYGGISNILASFGAKALQGFNFFDPEDGHTPISQYMRGVTLPLVREWLMPYHQRWFIGDQYTQVKDGFPEYIAEMTNDVEGINVESVLSGFKAAQQFIPGGNGWTDKPDDACAVSFRGINPKTGRPYAASFGAMSVFFNATETGALHGKEWSDKVHKKCFGPEGILSKKDMRFIWAPFGSWNMDKHWERYFDSREKYERVLATKKKADPFDVFTPNAFCVGASSSEKLLRNVPYDMAIAWQLDGVAKRPRDGDADVVMDTNPKSRSRKR